ncbi:hypothetical protein C8R45DRAFT_929138 [Mycena sanguinolenta]|nr:hypothetical protein C8R45DRAFT_929138 [Mycena sanguinolenta]
MTLDPDAAPHPCPRLRSTTLRWTSIETSRTSRGQSRPLLLPQDDATEWPIEQRLPNCQLIPLSFTPLSAPSFAAVLVALCPLAPRPSMCVPPFHPSPGHEDRQRHDNSANCTYYFVFKGWVRGIYTNSWIARAQTDGYTGSLAKSFKLLDVGLDWWDDQCDAHHQHQCPPFEPVTFSLMAHPTTQPGLPPCSGVPFVDAAIPAAPSPFNTPSPLSPTPSVFASSVKKKHSPSPSPSPLRGVPRIKIEEPTSPSPKKSNERTSATPFSHVNATTRVSLTLAGVARANLLQARANLQAALDTPPRSAAPGPSVVVTPAPPSGRASPQGSLLVTPNARPAPAVVPCASAATVPPTPGAVVPPALAPALAPAPDDAPVPALAHPLVVVTDPNTGEHTYGIRGVSVFYSSYKSAKAAAKKLGLEDGKIMVSSNVDKVEAWMTNQPFVGDDV